MSYQTKRSINDCQRWLQSLDINALLVLLDEYMGTENFSIILHQQDVEKLPVKLQDKISTHPAQSFLKMLVIPMEEAVKTFNHVKTR